MPIWIYCVFIFAFGCCIGSFLNVVIYRMPRAKSLVKPPSACPACGRHIAFYDNIPLLSWLVLGAKCRFCKASISPRYFIIELLTGLIFVVLFILFFNTGIRRGIDSFSQGGWFIYLVTIILLAALIASSAIDLELWVIPITICWFITAVGLFASAIAPFIIDPAVISRYMLLPAASPTTASLSLGAAIGLIISLILLETGHIKRSYEAENQQAGHQSEDNTHPTNADAQPANRPDQALNHRAEVCKEIVFLLPIIFCSLAAYLVAVKVAAVSSVWADFSQRPVVTGFLGALWGYFIGCAIVWATRILGTLGFGREAMGLGDVHLMGAAGAIIGPIFVVVAFFIAPFFGLIWALFQMFFKKVRQIPYGPFLSLGVFTVIILHDWVLEFIIRLFLVGI